MNTKSLATKRDVLIATMRLEKDTVERIHELKNHMMAGFDGVNTKMNAILDELIATNVQNSRLDKIEKTIKRESL